MEITCVVFPSGIVKVFCTCWYSWKVMLATGPLDGASGRFSEPPEPARVQSRLANVKETLARCEHG